MKKSTLISLISLGVALIGALIALTVWFSHKKCVSCSDFEDEMMPEFNLNPDVDLDIDFHAPESSDSDYDGDLPEDGSEAL